MNCGETWQRLLGHALLLQSLATKCAASLKDASTASYFGAKLKKEESLDSSLGGQTTGRS